MRLIPSTPLSCLGTVAVAVVVGGVLLVGCEASGPDTVSALGDSASQAADDLQGSASDAASDAAEDLEGAASDTASQAAEDTGFDWPDWNWDWNWDWDIDWFGGGDELDLDLGIALPSAVPEEEPSDAPDYTLPESCAAAGVAGAVGDLAPGTALTEERGAVEGVDGAEQLVCSYGDGNGEPGAPTLTVVFTHGADPSVNPDVVEVPGAEEEMNWEVDVDVDVDTYHTEESDHLGGDLEYVGTVDGSSRHLYLSLPGELYVTVIVVNDEVERADLERVVLEAASLVRN
ncbi:hypothetical protein [Nocardiopsis sp. CNT312]|uniref:hypothetical protein n=1 Tax=Nocardiopsis sp. CNT312 TaxID=1137268 RepID=UPI00048B0E39|nr:hypothetical protein [Nocardiopsis sp. CNT312]